MKNRIFFGLIMTLWLHLGMSTANTPAIGNHPGSDLTSDNNLQKNAYALLIGINKYKHVRDLNGAVNDVHRIKKLLVDSFNFIDDKKHIKVLTDKQATRKAIIKGIENHLVRNANRNSIIILHYSGHGSRVKDVSGDEADGFDETIVPHDSGREPHPNRDITDDELNLLLTQLTARTPNVTFIFDSCHSGTAIRASGLARTIPADERVPLHQLTRQIETLQIDSDDYSDLRSQNSAYVLISGSAADEESLELRKNNQSFGAMTWFLTDQIRQAGSNATYRDVMDIVKARVSAKYPSQHPQLEGTGRDRLVFNTHSIEARPYVLVTPKNNKRVVLNAGQVHGVTIGSIYNVFPPGEKDFNNGQKAIAKIKVSEIFPTTAYSEIIDGGNIKEASRAIESQHYYPNQVLKVYLRKSKILNKIKKKLSKYKHIKILKQEKNYDLLLREHLGYIITEAGDPTEITPRILISKPDVIGKTVKQIIQWGKWFNILNIKNINSNLNIKFSIDTSTSSEEIFEGSEFSISIENKSKYRLYIALLDLSSDGQIQIVFPKADGKDYLEPGHSIKKWLKAYLPKKFDSIRDILKIIATTEPTNYHFLVQEPIINAPTLGQFRGDNIKKTSPLEEFLANAAIATNRGVSIEDNLVDPGNWVTLERTIKVLRKLH